MNLRGAVIIDVSVYQYQSSTNVENATIKPIRRDGRWRKNWEHPLHNKCISVTILEGVKIWVFLIQYKGSWAIRFDNHPENSYWLVRSNIISSQNPVAVRLTSSLTCSIINENRLVSCNRFFRSPKPVGYQIRFVEDFTGV